MGFGVLLHSVRILFRQFCNILLNLFPTENVKLTEDGDLIILQMADSEIKELWLKSKRVVIFFVKVRIY